MTAISLSFAVALVLARAPQADQDRAEFERLFPSATYPHVTDLIPQIFSDDEETFVTGVGRLTGFRFSSIEPGKMIEMSLIAFRRARDKKWARGQEAAEWFILVYMGNIDRDRAHRVRQRLEAILKDADDPSSRKTRKLMALADGKAEHGDLLELSKDSRAEVRNFAIHRLADRNDPADTAHIGSCLKDADPTVRGTVIQALGKRGAAEFADAIAEQIDDPQYFIRRVAIGAIGQMKVHRLAKRIVPFLADPTGGGGDARTWALGTLMALEPGEAVDDVLKLFSHEDASVRKSAVSLVGHWKHKRSMPVVTAMLRDPDALVRVEAVEALASMGATDASGLVAERLEDEAETVRSRAAVALGRLGAKSHSGKIADFGREGRLTKTAAAEALLLLDARDKSAAIVDLLEAMAQAEAGKPGRGDVVEDRSRKPSFTDLVMLACRKEMNDCVVDLLKRIEKNIPAFRTGVLYAVSESGNSALLKRLGEEGLLVSKEAQHNALRAYEKTLTAETIPALMDLVRTLDESVQRHLGLVERRLSEFPEKVAPFTEDKSPAVRRLAGLALCNSRQVKHLPRLMKLMEDLDTNVRASITQSAAFMPSTDHHELIGRRLADPEAWVRRAAVSGVWWLRLNRFTPNVVGLLADPDPITVETVLYALEFLDIKDQSARIVPLLDNPKWAARAADLLRKSGAAEAVKPLLKLAKEGAPEARAAAIRALAVLGGKDRVSDLDALLADKEDEIRAAGAFAVGVFKDSGRKEAVIALLKDPRHVVKAEAATALAELGARDQAAGIVALLDLPDEQPIQVTAGGHKSSRYMAEEAAAAALVKFNAVESAPDLARLLKASKDSFATQRLAFALIRLAPKRYLEEILSSHVQGWKLGALYEVNRAKAPRLYAKIGAAPPADPRCLERGLLERRAERFGQVFGVKILIDPAVPDAIRRSEEAAAMPGRTAHQLFTSIIPLGCSAIFDDDTGEARIVTLEEAKRFWLDWAKEPK